MTALPELLPEPLVGEDEQLPIFSLSQVQYEWQGNLRHLVVRNNILIMGMRDNRVLRIDLMQPQSVEDIELTRKSPDQESIHKLHLDHTGRHLLISMVSGDVYYLHLTWKKPKLLTKLRNVVLECAAWSRWKSNLRPTATGPVLLGTDRGLIYEVELDASEDFFRKEERYVKQVHSLADDGPITGINFITTQRQDERFKDHQKKYAFVFVTTLSRIHQFSGVIGNLDSTRGDSLFEQFFVRARSVFQELPGDLSYGELHLYTESSGKQSFAWLCSPGIYYGDIVIPKDEKLLLKNDFVIENAQLLPYPAELGSLSKHQELQIVPPKTIALSAYHFLLLYENSLKAICRLNDEIIWEESISSNKVKSPVLGLTVDDIKHTYWVFTEKSLYELVITAEDRNIWSLYLNKRLFESAYHHCKTLEQKNSVREKQAEFHFQQGQLLLAAAYYAQTSVPLEQVAMKFMSFETSAEILTDKNSDQHNLARDPWASSDALQTYLTKTLEKFQNTELKTQQRTLLATWILELFLKKLKFCKTVPTQQIRDDFYSWLGDKSIQNSLNPKTTYRLFSDYGCSEEMIHYGKLIGDFDRVLNYYVQKQSWSDALEILIKQGSIDNFYKFSPVLMEHVPYETVNCWIRFPQLNPKHLIPGLLKYDPSNNPRNITEHQGIRYLEHCVKRLNNTDPLIHNLLLSLYVSQEGNDETLIAFVKAPSRCFNLQYALRLCSRMQRLHACVVIYGELGLFEEAVGYALNHRDLELAQIYSFKPDDENMRKKLWLKIMKFLIQEEHDIPKALELMKVSNVLQIEDILQYLPDTMTVHDFKEQICDALNNYKHLVQELKSDMEEATKSAEATRLDLRELKKRFIEVPGTSKCALCQAPLFMRAFYVFPCEHVFHTDCLLAYMMKECFGVTLQQRVIRLQEKLAQQYNNINDQQLESEKEKSMLLPLPDDSALYRELDQLIGSDCALCGHYMIQSIDKPFIDETMELETIEAWKIL